HGLRSRRGLRGERKRDDREDGEEEDAGARASVHRVISKELGQGQNGSDVRLYGTNAWLSSEGWSPGSPAPVCSPSPSFSPAAPDPAKPSPPRHGGSVGSVRRP